MARRGKPSSEREAQAGTPGTEEQTRTAGVSRWEFAKALMQLPGITGARAIASGGEIKQVFVLVGEGRTSLDVVQMVRETARTRFGLDLDPRRIRIVHDSDDEAADIERNGIIRADMNEGDPPPTSTTTMAIAPARSPGMLAERIRVLAEGIPVQSEPHEELRQELVERYIAAGGEVAEPLGLDLLGDLAIRSAQIALLRRESDALVAQARTVGVNWTDIGRATGITSQAARRRWDPEARKRHTDYERVRKQGRPAVAASEDE